ncbi:HD-domain/PDEase-like protein [Punctularia strigosozonata HHB-11173 SS5]|uniref:HD-domain/PDEase-like protein n=1 Tax=Punctularia strigosozonata (strain HHB-11173) TaxID=741275 RepID=UPI0004416DAB|nr:HD-domain/PDEase-like protein [Punctularia strigosozonata HHB-11173 SS5]EIN11232.1 HD-domain/PDEase-like protein [Punctularia strigosozonata HHB-11173 SS5]
MCRLHPPTQPGNGVHGRRRSVDVGGLSLAMQGEGYGHGWGGWEENEIGEVRYAELLSDMYTATRNAATGQDIDVPPLEISDETRNHLIRLLDKWDFEPHKLSEEEMVACSLILFEALLRVEGMRDTIGVSMDELSSFLSHLRRVYRTQNSYHNFQHALDVLQATHMFLSSANIIPHVSILLSDEHQWQPTKTRLNCHLSKLTNHDLLALYLAAIGHDVGHPGYSNAFLRNAKAPLSEVYDGKSALENLHCALLLPIMRRHGLGHLLDHPASGSYFRELLLKTVLATDMSVHGDFMRRFKQLSDGDLHVNEQEEKILICQAVVKCADISNPCRPVLVSQHWAAALGMEWTNQAMLEKQLDLPKTVSPAEDPLMEAKSQVFFIDTFALPLFTLFSDTLPDMDPYTRNCAENLAFWRARCSALSSAPRIAEPSPATPSPNAGVKLRPPSPAPSVASVSEEFLNAFPLALPTVLFSPPDEELESSNSARSRSPSPSRTPVSTTSEPTYLRARTPSPTPSMPGAWPSTPPGTPPLSPDSPRTQTPRSDTFSFPAVHLRTISVSSSASVASHGTSHSGLTSGGNAAIRTANDMGLRTKQSLKNFHRYRNSWSASRFLDSEPGPTLPALNTKDSKAPCEGVPPNHFDGGEPPVTNTCFPVVAAPPLSLETGLRSTPPTRITTASG